MELHSEFRVLFLIKKNIFFFLFNFFFFFVFYNHFSDGNSEIIIAWLILFVFSIFCQLINLSSINKIIVSEKGITKTTLVSREIEFIPFSAIVTVNTEHVQGSYSSVGQITTGYFESVVFLKNGKKLLISPDHFENYKEIIALIRQIVL